MHADIYAQTKDYFTAVEPGQDPFFSAISQNNIAHTQTMA